MEKLTFSLLILLFSACVQAASYYKCVEPNGHILFTDRHCAEAGIDGLGNQVQPSASKPATPISKPDVRKQTGTTEQTNKPNEPVGRATPGSEIATVDTPKKFLWQRLLDISRSRFPSAKSEADSPVMEKSSADRPPADRNAEKSVYSCQGKTRCTEMNSCAEATFYLNHCPDVKIDGDHDGIPCEQQWCK